MVDAYLSIARDADAEIEVKRSRFIGWARAVSDEQQARAVIDAARREHWDARHHCSAFVLGPDSQLTRSSDDGEPSGTAGIPILQTITGRSVTDVVVVVIRYFGGTLLGTGGLVRAYTDTAAAALDAAGVRRFERAEVVEIEVELALAGKLENAVRGAGFTVSDVGYGSRAVLTAEVAPARHDELAGLVAQLAHGDADVRAIGTTWTAGPVS